MATSKSKPKKMKKTKFKPWLIFILIIILIALISMGISYYLTNSENLGLKKWAANSQNSENVAETQATNQVSEKTPLEGSWVSYYDGAIFTFTGFDFILEIPSVDSPEKTTGKIAVAKTIVTFYYTSGNKSCLDVEGHYQFTFHEGQLNFKIIKDLCSTRKERMTANWFKL